MLALLSKATSQSTVPIMSKFAGQADDTGYDGPSGASAE